MLFQGWVQAPGKHERGSALGPPDYNAGGSACRRSRRSRLGPPWAPAPQPSSPPGVPFLRTPFPRPRGFVVGCARRGLGPGLLQECLSLPSDFTHVFLMYIVTLMFSRTISCRIAAPCFPVAVVTAGQTRRHPTFIVSYLRVVFVFAAVRFSRDPSTCPFA